MIGLICTAISGVLNIAVKLAADLANSGVSSGSGLVDLAKKLASGS